MRIAVIGTISSSLISFRGALIQRMVELGHVVYAFAIDFDVEGEAAVRALGAIPVRYPLDRTGTHPLRDLRSLVWLARELRSRRIDLLFSYFLKPAIYGTLAGAVAGVPRRYALLPGLGYAFTDNRSSRALIWRVLDNVLPVLIKASLARADAVFFYNPDDVAEVLRRRLVAKNKIHRVAGTGIDLDEFPAAPAVKTPITFLLAARLLREKGIVEYAEAARIVKHKHPEARFVLLGGLDTNPGALRREEVEAWVREGILEWPGHVRDVRPWFAQASVYVLPSYREGVPRSTQEAMAMARPVITTDAPGCRETVVHGRNGFLVPPRSSEALVEAMEQFIRNPDLIETMGHESRKLAEERFDVHRINRRFLDIMGIRATDEVAQGVQKAV